MTNKEVNEYLAEHLFGLQRDRWGNLIDRNNSGIFEIGENGACRVRDYISNYQPVLEELTKRFYPDGESKIEIRIDWRHKEVYLYNYRKQYSFANSTGETIGEAICKVAIEYLKTKKIIW